MLGLMPSSFRCQDTTGIWLIYVFLFADGLQNWLRSSVFIGQLDGHCLVSSFIHSRAIHSGHGYWISFFRRRQLAKVCLHQQKGLQYQQWLPISRSPQNLIWHLQQDLVLPVRACPNIFHIEVLPSMQCSSLSIRSSTHNRVPCLNLGEWICPWCDFDDLLDGANPIPSHPFRALIEAFSCLSEKCLVSLFCGIPTFVVFHRT